MAHTSLNFPATSPPSLQKHAPHSLSNPNYIPSKLTNNRMKTQRSKRKAIELAESFMKEPLPSVKIPSQKRNKRSSPLPNSNPFKFAYTRSNSRIFYHQNRSGLSRPDPVARKPMESVEAFLGVNCRSAPRILLTKDLRHKRVFSPGVNSVPEEEIEDRNEERKKLLKGFDSSTVPDVNDVKEYELRKSWILRSEVGDERIDGTNCPKLKDQTISGNGSLPKMKMALNGCHRKKVFKNPSSFSYRRLLPHLMNIVNDTSSVSNIEIVDAESTSRFAKLDGVDFEMRSIAEKSYAPKKECFVPKFNGLKKALKTVLTIQQDSSGADNELNRTAETVSSLEVKEKGHENDMNGGDASVEENIQTTPPDPGIYAKTEVGRGRESADAKKMLTENQTFMGLPVGSEKSSNEALKQSPNTKCSTNSMSETVLNPCSRLRLLKNPRSLSYRRLLPFLMDISKTDSCTSRKPQQKIPLVVPEEDRHPAPVAISEHDYVNNTTKKIYSEDLIQTASDGLSPDSNNNLVSSTPESSATFPDLGMLMKETPRSQSGVAKLQLDLGSTESTSVSEPRSVEKQNMCSSMGLEHNNGNTESISMVNLKQYTFQIKTSDALVSSDNRPFKGILKRNRRGCRGLCSCLNCASFRLHAERAFEFSRNQLHDAEEVASELMKELANVRLLLEKSIIGKDDSASVRAHLAHIKQACNKAIEVETLAKERLGELNNDLNVHCRIPDLLQPKVTFAYNTQ